MMLIVGLLVACSGTESQESSPSNPSPSADGPDVEVNKPPTEAELLEAGAPGAVATERALLRLADAFGAGVARCTVAEDGRIRRVYGTERDQVLELGAKFMVEVDEDEVPWMPIYDEIIAEDGWTALLVRPGETEAYVHVGDRGLHFTFPPAVAGEVVTCTAVRPISTRVVRGKVEPTEGTAMLAHGCTPEGTLVARDGTFVLEARVPCALWVETDDGRRSDPVTVLPGEGKLVMDAPLPLRADRLQGADRTWTELGRARLQAIVDTSDQRVPEQKALLERALSELEEDEPAQVRIERYQALVYLWERQVGQIRKGLDGKLPL